MKRLFVLPLACALLYSSLLNAQSWNISGNAGTNASIHFVGTTDNQPLRFRIWGAYAGLLSEENVFFGKFAGLNHTTSFSNVAIGRRALYWNTTIGNTVAVGDSALYNLRPGVQAQHAQRNTAVGSKALFATTDGYDNTATGYMALYANTTGASNTANGFNALAANSTGFGGAAFGAEALQTNNANYNTGLGWRTLWSNTSGAQNTASGSAAMIMNTTGNQNTATGYYALGDNRTGTNNSAFGFQALGFGNTGNTNTGVGAFAGGNNAYGNSIVAVGAYALYWSRSRSNVVAVGDSALYWNGYSFANPTGSQGTLNTAVGSKALFNNTNGYLNTAVGARALYQTTTGNSNTAIGYNAYPVSGTVSNYTGIGYNVGSGSSISNSVEIGNSSVVWIGGQVGWSTYSDERIKDNIKDDVQGLSFITKLRPVTYNLNIHRQNDMTLREKIKDDKEWPEKYAIEKKKITGFLAQQVEEAAKACNYDFHGVTKPEKQDGLYSLSYAEFVVPLVKAVQEQQAIIEKLQKKLEELEKRVANCPPAPTNF
jgi:trimeric autotransporter adhesin